MRKLLKNGFKAKRTKDKKVPLAGLPLWIADRSEAVFLSSSITRYAAKGIFYRINGISTASQAVEKL